VEVVRPRLSRSSGYGDAIRAERRDEPRPVDDYIHPEDRELELAAMAVNEKSKETR
jgi:hypothetical protein